MHTSDDEADKIIREALAGAEGAESLDDPGLIGLLLQTFRGRNRFLTIGGVVVNLLLVVVAVVALSRFSGAQDVREMLLWGGTALLAIGLILAVKIWFWMEMLRLDLIREVKRVEVQVARLWERMGPPPA